jgi:hypothetical protein
MKHSLSSPITILSSLLIYSYPYIHTHPPVPEAASLRRHARGSEAWRPGPSAYCRCTRHAHVSECMWIPPQSTTKRERNGDRTLALHCLPRLFHLTHTDTHPSLLSLSFVVTYCSVSISLSCSLHHSLLHSHLFIPTHTHIPPRPLPPL